MGGVGNGGGQVLPRPPILYLPMGLRLFFERRQRRRVSELSCLELKSRAASGENMIRHKVEITIHTVPSPAVFKILRIRIDSSSTIRPVGASSFPPTCEN